MILVCNFLVTILTSFHLFWCLLGFISLKEDRCHTQKHLFS